MAFVGRTKVVTRILRRLVSLPMRERLLAYGRVRRTYLWYRARRVQPDWSALGPVPTIHHNGDTPRPRILMATSVGALPGLTTFDSLIAIALRLRGADVEALLCDGALPACQRCVRTGAKPGAEFQGPRPDSCQTCHPQAERVYSSLDIAVHRYSTYLDQEEIGEIERLARSIPVSEMAAYVDRGVPVGEHAMAGCLRYYGRGDLEGQPMADQMLRRYFEAALRVNAALRRLLTAHRFDRVVIQHGIYVPQGVIRDVCRVMGVPVVAWDRAYRNQTFVLCHGDTHHRALGAEPEAVWHRRLTDEMRTRLQRYLDTRRTGSEDWVGFQRSPAFDLTASRALQRLDTRPRIVLLTSVTWDARIHYPSNAFPNMLAWVVATVRYFQRRPDLQLVIRIHPAEVHGVRQSKQRIIDELKRLMPDLPDNVLVVPPDDPVSTYAIADTCNAALIFNTKTGMELAACGLPVIVAGEAWIRGKGFATDVSSPEDYAARLDTLPLPQRLSPAETERARAFAYHIFFRRMLPLTLLKSPAPNTPFRHDVRSWDQLLAGRDANLDVICRGILEGTRFEAVELGYSSARDAS